MAGNGISGLGSRTRGLADSPDSVDRGLMIACAVVWLLVLGMVVAATVALVDLGRGRANGESGSSTSWLLYAIIAISALVIAAAIPLLLRARRGVVGGAADGRSSDASTPAAVVAPPSGNRPDYPGPTPARHSEAALPAAVLDRIWLRCGFGVLTATGAAMLAVALASYLLAVDAAGGAWAALGVAAVITIAMVAIPVIYLRQLQAALDAD